ncbi:hypothetical protein F5141DRAFT_1063609 [Pisolithus sp. B1]|nr:hypothetical protein F5141DRAFT_1063609 [Pisolithus sp. B1]
MDSMIEVTDSHVPPFPIYFVFSFLELPKLLPYGNDGQSLWHTVRVLILLIFHGIFIVVLLSNQTQLKSNGVKQNKQCNWMELLATSFELSLLCFRMELYALLMIGFTKNRNIFHHRTVPTGHMGAVGTLPSKTWALLSPDPGLSPVVLGVRMGIIGVLHAFSSSDTHQPINFRHTTGGHECIQCRSLRICVRNAGAVSLSYWCEPVGPGEPEEPYCFLHFLG